MNLHFTTIPLDNGRCRHLLAGEVFGEPLSVTQECATAENGATLCTMLLFLLARKADKFVATAMDLLPAGDGDLRTVADACAELVIRLDTAGDSNAEASALVNRRLPLYLRLVGKETYSGYVLRRREFDELTELAALIKRCVAGEEVFNEAGNALAA